MTVVFRLRLRRATLDDVSWLERWDTDPDVIAATTDDHTTERAFGGLDWRKELGQDSDVSYYLIAEVDGRPVGAMQICDPHVEPTHYWGTIEPNLRAIDIWIGATADRGKGYGREMMALAHERCFADSVVTAIVIDPLVKHQGDRVLSAARLRGGRAQDVRRRRLSRSQADP